MAWLGDWKYRRKITIDKTKIDATLTHFPVLLKLGSSVGISSKDVRSIFTEVGTSSKKIAITKSDGETEIYCEIERWDNTNKLAELWVSKSDLEIASDADTELYIYYDSTKADNTDFIGDTQSDKAKLVWDSNFKGVWHLDEAEGALKDATSEENDGANSGCDQGVDGKIGKAIEMDATSDRVTVSHDESLQITGNITIEAWIYYTSGGYYFVASKVFDKEFEIYFVQTTVEYARWYRSNNKTEINYTMPVGEWFHFVVVDNGANALIYENGAQVGSGASRTGTTGTSDVNIVNRPGANNAGVGKQDETRISNIARTAAWIKATYNAGNDSLITWGDEEAAPEPIYISGQVTLEGAAVEGAKVFLINDTDGTLDGVETTDSTGSYSFEVTAGKVYHIAAQYADGETLYHAKSYPFLEPE
jgi:hypothetical protein